MRSLLLTLLAAGLLHGQIQSPVAGFARDRAGALRPILGVPGAFVAGEPIATGVLAAAFSGSVGLAKTEAELLVFDASGILERRAAPPGLAAFEFDAKGQPARAWFPASRELWTWQDSGIKIETPSSDPEWTSQVRRDGADWIVLQTQTRIPAPDGPVEQMSADWIVIHAADGCHALRIEAGRELAVLLPEPRP